MDKMGRLQAQGSAATLLFGAHDEERNNAVVLRDYLLERMSGAQDEGRAHHAEVMPTPRERERKRTALRREEGDEPAAVAPGRRKRTRRASGGD